MRNFHAPGAVQDFVAPNGGVVSGGFYSFNGLICCATVDAAEGETFAGQICGVFRVTKAGSEAWAHGVSVYLTAGSATLFTTTAGGNTLAGKAAGVVGAGADETEGLVLLNGLPSVAIQSGAQVDLGSLRTLALGINFSVHGVDVTVTLPNDATVTARGIWLTDETEDQPPGIIAPRRTARRVLALRKSEVPTIPVGSLIEAPLLTGAEPIEWLVDGMDRTEAETWRVVVVPSAS